LGIDNVAPAAGKVVDVYHIYDRFGIDGEEQHTK
jgi:hypothetical protein